MRGGERDDVDVEVAHQPLDQVAPQPVVGGQRDAAHDRQPARFDRLGIGERGRRVLHVALRQRADRAGAEADQRRRGIVGVALERAMQLARRRRFRHRVAGARVMVEADRDVAAFLGQHAMDRVLLGEARQRPGQRVFGDELLVLLHPRHMGVAEHRDAVGVERQRAPRGAGDALLGLQRQAVDEVEVHRADAERARLGGAILGLLVGLAPADRLLHRRLEVLHAEADAGDAHVAERLMAVGRQRGRVELDGDLGVGRHANAARMRVMIAVRQSPGSEVGVPPPQWTCETGARRPISAATRPISRSSSAA